MAHAQPIAMQWSPHSNFVAHSQRTGAFFGRPAPDASDLFQDRDGASGLVAPASDVASTGTHVYPGTVLFSQAEYGGNEWLATNDLRTQSSTAALAYTWSSTGTSHTGAAPRSEHHQSTYPAYDDAIFQNQPYDSGSYQQPYPHQHIDGEDNSNADDDNSTDGFSLPSPSTATSSYPPSSYYPVSPASDSAFVVPSPTIDQISSYSTLSPVLEHFLSNRAHRASQTTENSDAPHQHPHHHHQQQPLRDPSWLALQQQQLDSSAADVFPFHSQQQQQRTSLLGAQDNVRQRLERFASSSPSLDSSPSSVSPNYHSHSHPHPHGHTTPTRRSSGPYDRPSPSSSPSSLHTGVSSTSNTPQQQPPSARRRRGTGRAPREVAKKPPPPMACLFCRGRKIACSAPPPDATDRTCDQCQRRGQVCEYPLTSRRGQRKQPSTAVVATVAAIAGAPSSAPAAEGSSSPETA